ncbi:hypothetical protein QWY86_06785 [Pedobacter aquatilis]|uniref:hypothetical protein n=1 Tax=Pedobacter aquatilis TaxID=351343 RepID=UPI0025B46970|nr:hypothetical protein [Pedobacter aquatilis]MDN3586365.1 hypothetical protein [Pedobacter aquatilis]
MKKKKTPKKNQGTSKTLKKEIASKLTLAFSEIAKAYGKEKKAQKAIEKLAKQLSKKVTISAKQDDIAPFLKEDEPLTIVKEEKPNVKKPTKSKTKTAESTEAAS